VCRHGRSRPLRRYQSSRRRRNHCRSAGGGTVGIFRLRPRFSMAIIRDVKIYTKTGDSGDTGLFDGTRVPKSDPRVAAYGDVDELNAWLGLVRVDVPDDRLSGMLEAIQRDLF